MNSKKYPEGVGRNKKEAKHNAARNALASLENNEQVNTVLFIMHVFLYSYKCIVFAQ